MKKTNVSFGSAMTLIMGFVIVFGLSAFAPKNLHEDSKYRVFCANNKIEVEQRTLEQEKNARGSNVCQLAEFDYASDADK